MSVQPPSYQGIKVSMLKEYSLVQFKIYPCFFLAYQFDSEKVVKIIFSMSFLETK